MIKVTFIACLEKTILQVNTSVLSAYRVFSVEEQSRCKNVGRVKGGGAYCMHSLFNEFLPMLDHLLPLVHFIFVLKRIKCSFEV